MNTITENWKETIVTTSTLKACLRFARDSEMWGSGFTTQQNEVLDTIVDCSDMAEHRLEAVVDIYLEHAEGDFDQNKEHIEDLMSIVAGVASMAKIILELAKSRHKNPAVADVIESRMSDLIDYMAKHPSDLKQVNPKAWECMLAYASEVRNESASEGAQFPTMYLGDQVPEGHIEISGSHVGPGCLVYTDCSNMIVQDTHAWIPWGNLTPEYQASKDIKAQRCCRAKDDMIPADVRAVGTASVFDFSISVPESFLRAESCPENTERFADYIEQQCRLSDLSKWSVLVRTPYMDRSYIVKLQDGTKFLIDHTK